MFNQTFSDWKVAVNSYVHLKERTTLLAQDYTIQHLGDLGCTPGCTILTPTVLNQDWLKIGV